MRTLTTAWNASSFADAATFLDKKAGTYVTVPAATPVDHRSMTDSVNGGDYEVLASLPTTMTNDTTLDAVSVEEEATVDVVVTLTDGSDPVEGIRLTAVSTSPAVFTVSPAYALTDASGQVTFTVTGVVEGGEDLTIQVASDTTIENVVAVTVTAPA